MDKEYASLLDSYKRMLEMVDAFHFNSKNTADVYSRYLTIPDASKIIPITHGGISDRRRLRHYDEKVLRLGFIGSEAPYKGLPLLKEVIDDLNKKGFLDKICLNVFGGRTGVDNNLKNVHYRGRYTSSAMEQVFDSMDVLIVPSIWYETFSLVALEALSFGTVVLVSDKVGAKDIVANYSNHFVYGTREELLSQLRQIAEDRHELIEYNKRLIEGDWLWSIESHAKEIVDVIYKDICR